MAGEFLPPVVTTLDGEIQPLLDKLAQAKAAIKALGDQSFTVPINVELNKVSLAKAMADLKGLSSQGVTVPVKAEANIGSLAGAMAGMQAVASSHPIHIPTTIDPARGFFYAGTGAYNPNDVLGGWNQFRPGPDNGAGGGGFWRGLGGGIAGAWAGRPFQNYPTTTFAAPWFLGGGRMGYTAAHAGLLGLGALGMGAIGTLLGAGSLAAVYGSGAGNLSRQATNLFSAQEAIIPPGVPDYALARAFGLTNVGPNTPLGQAAIVGTGQVYSSYGTLLDMLNRKGPLGGLIANTGTSAGLGLTNWLSAIAGRPGLNGNTLGKFFSSTTGDAANIGAGLGNLFSFAGHAFAHMPGELEWATQGFRDLTGGLNNLWKVPGLKSVLGGGLFGGMLLHSTTLGAHLLGNGLNMLGKLPFIPAGLGGTAARAATAADVSAGLATREGEMIGGSGLVAAGMFNPITLTAAATLGAGLGIYRYQTPTSAAIRGINSNLYNVGTGTFGNHILAAMRLFSNGAANGSTGGPGGVAGFLNDLFGFSNSPIAQSSGGNWWGSKFSSTNSQNMNALLNAQGAFVNYGGGVNAVARAMGISTSEAANWMAMAGVKMGKNRQIQGGDAQAVRLVQAFRNANGIFNGQPGEIGANMSIAAIVGDSAWKQAATINGNWDTYMTALTGGGVGLGNLASVMARTAPSVANNLTRGGLIGTSQGIQSAGQPLMDFFRQAQSTGAISGKALQQSFLQVAASMGPLAGKSAAARSELVALANESGLNVKSFGQLMHMEGGAGNASRDLAHSVAATTIAMSKVPAIAQKINTDVTSNVAGMAAAIVAKSKPAYDAFNNLTTMMEKYGAGSQKVASSTGPMVQAFLSAHMPTQTLVTLLQQLGINLNKIPANIKKELHIDTNAGQAAGEFTSATSAWRNVPNGQVKTNSVITYMETQYAGVYNKGQGPIGPRLINPNIKHTALGVRNRTMGAWSWVGEHGPELMYQPSGTTIIPAHRTGQTIANAMTSGGSGDIHNHIYIDGKEMFGVIKKQTYDYNTQNGNRSRGGRLRGTMAPRG